MSEMVLQEGNIGDLPLVDLVLLARGSRWPTALELTRGGTTRRFDFRDGDLERFTTTNPKEGLIEFLKRRKKLDEGTAATLSATVASEGLSEVEVVMRDGGLGAAALRSEMSAWSQVLLVQSFAWDDGTFSVVADADSVPPALPLEVSVPTALTQAVWKRMELGAVRAYTMPYLDERARAAEDLPFRITDFRLTPERLRFWEEVREARTAREALESTTLGEEEALRTFFLLQRSGMLEMVPAAPEEEDEFDLDGEDASSPDVNAWLNDLGDFGDDEPDEDQVSTNPSMKRFEPQGRPEPIAPPPQPSVPVTPPSTGRRSDLGVDLSSIGFKGGMGARPSSTSHITGGSRERMAPSTPRAASPAASTPAQPRTSGLAGLFSDMDLPSSGGGQRTVAPPRGGRAGWSPTDSGRAVSPPRGVTPPRGAAPAAAAPASADGPPRCPGPIIEAAEWDNLPTKEKERVRGLRQMLIDFEGLNYFEYFELSEEASESLIKKAYFKMARRFHPDALVDEGEIYARLAEAVFAEISEAYETLSDEEAREKYVAKVIRGEKDENELAMEKVQQILGAESAYKSGVRLINQGKAPAAVDKLQEAVDLYGEEPEYRGWLGYALFRANQRADYEKALGGEEMLVAAIAEKPTAADLPHLMGKIAMQRKDWNNARKWLRKSLKMKPDNPEALREYKRVDEMLKGGAAAQQASKEQSSGLKGLFGRLGGKK